MRRDYSHIFTGDVHFIENTQLKRVVTKGPNFQESRATRFFFKQCQAEIGKKAIGKQHPEGEYLLFKKYSYSSSTLSSKNNRTYSKK